MSHRNEFMSLEILEKFTKPEGACNLWTGPVSNCGDPRWYAVNMHEHGASVKCWYVSEVLGIERPKGMKIYSSCRNKMCLAEDHIREFMRYCRNKHEYTPENTGHDKEGTRYCKACKYAYQKRHYYGLEEATFNQMLIDQGFTCKICKRPFAGQRPHHIDHDHVTGRVRGILCGQCNTLLGMAHDNTAILGAAIGYLTNAEDPLLAVYGEGNLAP